MPLHTPLVLILYKRPEHTAQLLAALRSIQPLHLFVIADGPRHDRPDEVEKCEETRLLIDQIDWDCQIIKNYASDNLGCARRVATGLDWVFEQVEEAIILEDDCVPDPSFFPFCEELLARYRFDTRVGSIAAQDFADRHLSDSESYYFSRYHHCWGWATWRRAWQHFDFTMSHWQTVQRQQLLKNILPDSRSVKFWTKALEGAYTNRIQTWAHRWMLSCWLNSSLSIHPKVNLVTNTGFGEGATNTTRKSKFENLPLEAIAFPLAHPSLVFCDPEADRSTQRQVYEVSDLQRVKLKLEKIFQPILSLSK